MCANIRVRELTFSRKSVIAIKYFVSRANLVAVIRSLKKKFFKTCAPLQNWVIFVHFFVTVVVEEIKKKLYIPTGVRNKIDAVFDLERGSRDSEKISDYIRIIAGVR